MKYSDFPHVISQPRLSRYLIACAGDTRKAMTLYRLNLRLSHEMFTIISCFEIALRNRIDHHCLLQHGPDWLSSSVDPGGIFTARQCRVTASIIRETKGNLGPGYSHNKLVAELGFGFWRFMFARHQYRATGRNLLSIFPNRPSTTPAMQYNNIYVLNQLAAINDIRNRIAHHKPICFLPGAAIDCSYTLLRYQLILDFFSWMNIDSAGLLYGLNHIDSITHKIMAL